MSRGPNGDAPHAEAPVASRLAAEGLTAAAEAARRAGVHVSVWTILRWIHRGVRAGRLEAVKVGGRWFTSVAAVRRFVELGVLPRRRTAPGQASSVGQAAERYLNGIGLGRRAGGDPSVSGNEGVGCVGGPL